MDAVLPLLGRDFDRARRLLFPTLAAHAQSLTRVFVIVPNRDLAAARKALIAARPFEVVFLAESAVVPEERYFLRHRRGWWLQQLIKLAMVDWVEGDFYLTLDCDLLCTKPWQLSDVIVDGRAVLERDTLRPGQNLAWYEQASELLGLAIPVAGMSVTPVIYSVDVVRGLARHLEGRVPSWLRLASRPTPSRYRDELRGWRFHLRRHIPWTEMSLYATYLEAAGLVGTYHNETWEPRLYGNNVWTREQFDAWIPSKSVDAPFLFTVVGSKCGASVDEVVTKVGDLLPLTGPE